MTIDAHRILHVMRLTRFSVDDARRNALISQIEARLLPLHRPELPFVGSFVDSSIDTSQIQWDALDFSIDQWFGQTPPDGTSGWFVGTGADSIAVPQLWTPSLNTLGLEGPTTVPGNFTGHAS